MIIGQCGIGAREKTKSACKFDNPLFLFRHKKQMSSYYANHHKIGQILLLLVIGLIGVTLVQDFLRAVFHDSAFYLSESFLFSSFWWIFAPLCYAQYGFLQSGKTGKLVSVMLLIVVPCLLHLFLFPVLVWAISALFYDHTFAIRQTLQYTLAEHLYMLTALYSIPVLGYAVLGKRTTDKKEKEQKEAFVKKEFSATLLVSQGNVHTAVAVDEILYITATTPYVNIHLPHKKYLHNETLRSMLEKLDDQKFVRVHKSTIIHIRQVRSYTSRSNGDYDVTMSDGFVVRLSRNYAADFKSRLK